MQFKQYKPPVEKKEGCKIKVKRDSSGRINSIETNGLCNNKEIEVFKEQLENKDY